MKTFTILLSTLVMIGACVDNKLRKMSDEEFIERALANDFPAPDAVTILTTSGTQISSDSLMKLFESGEEYFQDFYLNKDNKIVHLINRKKTEEDDDLIARINDRLRERGLQEPTNSLATIQIDCSNLPKILDQVYQSDQGNRNGGSIDQDIDHENLEIIVSIIDQCGLPTLDLVNQTQMDAIWLVLQHAPPYYQAKYIPLLEESANKGDLRWSSIALMKDRALMYRGEPQIFGSQISNGELYDLWEPEYVDQRREEIGMEPLKDYLARFNISFDIEQKTK